MLSPGGNHLDPQKDDINEKLAAMREEDVRVTFTDIWLDYKRYRKAYYREQVITTAKQQSIENEVKVDFETFTVRKEMAEKWRDREAES